MIYYFDDCALDTNLFTLQRGGKNTRLRLKVFRMCLYLLEHRDRVVSREELCTQVWPGQFVSQATLEGVIRLVRQAVGDNGRTQNVIQTLHGHGYRFVASVREYSLSGVGEEGPGAAAFRPTLEKDAPPSSADIPADMVAVLEAEEPFIPGQPEETQPRTPETNAQNANNRRNIRLEERWGAHLRGRSGWRMSHVGMALALVTLVLLGGDGHCHGG